MIRRPRRTVPAVLVALVVLAAAALVATSCVQLLLDRPPLVRFDTLTAPLADVAWRSVVVRIVGGAVAAVGLLLLLAALVPGRARVLPLGRRDGADTADAGIHRSDAARLLRAAAQEVVGVDRATVDLRRTSVRVRATVARADGDRARTELRERLEARIADLELARAPRLRLSFTRAKEA